ncbi:hypothetical protein PU629_11920 [Pullulanibacillus sp. KACC 23026]|uniref:hypothetical protein n=1 Tax=Pullulanibacillus sp. KACC 23026 TaxID=3028315 RepID=UPI0023AEF87B|nr:hypothetical protein [Pullulanibacillus sp. KACC 23026]WEG10886.1 hypothetical protein PU629_11920 [Pullulanibacillus sp. KACC 23026]
MKIKTLFLLSLIVCLGVSLSACGKSGQSSSSKSNQSASTQSSDKQDSTSSSTDTSSKSGDQRDPSDPNEDPFVMLKRMDAVIKATLDVEGKKSNTKVDYKAKTMTQNGEKVTFSIQPTKAHQLDFKKGAVEGVFPDGKKTQSVVLYNYTIDNSNNLSLIDVDSKKVIYKTVIVDPTAANPENNS